MEFTNKGADKFERDHARRRSAASPRRQLGGQQITQHFAIVLDREIKSFPQIDFTDASTRAASPARTAPRSPGLDSLQEAKDLALVLQTGALPGQVRARSTAPTSRRRSARTRSSEAKKRGDRRPAPRRALPAHLLPLPRPRRGRSGSAIYAAFLYAAILLFNVTLTLPGFAGLILTIGVAADANVVIFERIKEEVRAGQVRARRDRARATRRASTRSSTRTSSRRSRRSSCSPSRPRA